MHIKYSSGATITILHPGFFTITGGVNDWTVTCPFVNAACSGTSVHKKSACIAPRNKTSEASSKEITFADN